MLLQPAAHQRCNASDRFQSRPSHVFTVRLGDVNTSCPLSKLQIFSSVGDIKLYTCNIQITRCLDDKVIHLQYRLQIKFQDDFFSYFFISPSLTLQSYIYMPVNTEYTQIRQLLQAVFVVTQLPVAPDKQFLFRTSNILSRNW